MPALFLRFIFMFSLCVLDVRVLPFFYNWMLSLWAVPASKLAWRVAIAGSLSQGGSAKLHHVHPGCPTEDEAEEIWDWMLEGDDSEDSTHQLLAMICRCPGCHGCHGLPWVAMGCHGIRVPTCPEVDLRWLPSSSASQLGLEMCPWTFHHIAMAYESVE